VEAHSPSPVRHRLGQDRRGLFQGHGGGVVHLRVGSVGADQLPVHEAPGVDDHMGLPQKPGALYGNELGIAGAGADEIDYSVLDHRGHRGEPLY